jgi:alpha-tubulin suppressor-like RCC1 family protein
MTLLYGFGSNGSGQLGIGHVEDTNIPTPCLGLPLHDPVQKISGGGNHAAVITKTGQLFMSGYSQFGEEHQKLLSSDSDKDNNNIEYTRFQRRFEDLVWKDVACGWAFTILLASTGKLYGIGTSRWNELAGPSTQGSTLTPIDHVHLDQIVSVACGWRHAVALDEQGQVYGWGWGKHGQLGPPTTPPKDKKDIRSVQRIEMPQPIVQVACGHVHTLLRGQDGTVYGLGSNKYHQLTTDQEMPFVLKKDITWIDAGWHHSAALDNKGNLTLWGRNDRGQLGNGSYPHIKQIACGSEHMVVLYENTGHVAAWGWNEHGNCASDLDYTNEAIILDQFGPVEVIGAGCATSWFGIRAAALSSPDIVHNK